MTDQPRDPDRQPDTIAVVGVVAVGAGAMALVAVVLPAAARPMVSLVVALGLAAVAFVAVRQLARGVGRCESPFDHHARPISGEVPTELQALLRGVEASGTEPLSDVLAERLRRCAMRRLRDRHGADLRVDRDWRRLSTLVSPELYLVLTGQAGGVTGRTTAQLVDEVERL